MTRRRRRHLLWVLIGLCGCRDDGVSPVMDRQPPTVPTHVTAMVVSPSRVDIAWSASTDNVGVKGYKVYRDATLIRTLSDTAVPDTGLIPAVLHCYQVAAYDAANNESTRSPSTCAATVNHPPNAQLAWPVSALTATPVTLDATTSRDPDGAIVSYAFNFGDGTPLDTQATPIAVHSYGTAGNFTVSVSVTDNYGAAAAISGPITIGLALSTPVNVSNTPSMSQDASFARESTGALDVAWSEYGSDIMFARSGDAGATFTAPRYIMDPSAPLGSQNFFESDQMRVASAAGTIHVAWTIFDVLTGAAEVFYSRSTDAGASFSAPLSISTIDTINSYNPAIAAAGPDTVVIVWPDAALNGGLSGILLSRSVDGGGTFSTPLRLANGGVCPSVLVASPNVYVTWTTDGPIGQQAVLLVRSSDGGTSFSAPMPIDPVVASAFCATLTTDAAGILYATWSEGVYPSKRIVFARSLDGGATFGAPVALSPPTEDSSCPSLSLGDAGRVYVTWTGTSSYVAGSADGGVTFGPGLRIPPPGGGGGCYQIFAGVQDHIGLGWFDPPPGGNLPDVFYRDGQVSGP